MAASTEIKRQRLDDEELNFSAKRQRLDDEELKFLTSTGEFTKSVLDIIDDSILLFDNDVDDTDKDINVGTTSTMMVAGSFYIPKFSIEKPLGEDAHFICSEEQTIGVADGVGGWSKKGIDSGIYSRGLMGNAVSSIKKQQQDSNNLDLMEVLKEAFLNTDAKGSSTACMLTLANDTLQAVNVGDSGFVVIRDGVIVFKSEIQQSRFNCPFQLGRYRGDHPNVAEKISFPVKAGDVIVMGTDGLFDNVHDFELELVVNTGVESWELDEAETLAWRIAQYALENARNTELYTPFARESFKAGRDYSGGKYDDITVIVAHIWPL